MIISFVLVPIKSTFAILLLIILIFVRTPFKIIAPILVKGLSLKRQQVSSDLQVSFDEFWLILNNAVIWIASVFSLISNSSSLFPKPLRTVPSTPTTIGITVTFMFHSVFSFLARSKYLSSFLLSFIFNLLFVETAKSMTWPVLSFLLINTWFNLLIRISWSAFISIFRKISWVLFSIYAHTI